MRTPLEYGKIACETLMRKFKAEDLPPKKTLFYHQGVFLFGMLQIYKLTGDKKYFQYTKDYVDSVIGKNGEITGFVHETITEDTPDLAKYALTMLDHKQPSVLLHTLYDETREERYLNAIKTLGDSLYYWPINRKGGYWHKLTDPNQMWLDGAYMVGPFSIMYSERFLDPTLKERAIKQILLMDKHMKDSKTGLYFHGWDETKSAGWADKVTGCSSQIWGRALGWYAVAVLDVLDSLDESNKSYEILKRISGDLLEALAKFQDDETGMWLEVVDKPEMPDNWIETSASCLFIYSYAKAIRKGIITYSDFESVLNKAFNGIINSLRFDDEGYIIIDNVCIGTDIESGTYEHYIARERVKNDLHGVGAFVLMCAEMERFLKYYEDR